MNFFKKEIGKHLDKDFLIGKSDFIKIEARIKKKSMFNFNNSK